jgi:glucokinase
VRGREALAAAREQGIPTLLTGLEPVTAQDISRAATAGDAVARRVWNETTDLLGQAVTDLVNVLEPDAVILGGGVTRSGAMLLDPVRNIVKTTGMGPARAAAEVVLAGLGDVVCVIGAAAIAHDALARR